MLAEADLLLVDVVLLQIEDKFLLEAGGIGLLGEFLQVLEEFRLHCFNAFAFQFLHLVVEAQDGLHATGDVLVQDGAFLAAELLEMVQGLVDGGLHRGPVLFGDGIGLLRVHDVREAEEGSEQFAVRLVTGGGESGKFPPELEHLVVVALQGFGVDGADGIGPGGLQGEEKVDRTALQAVGEHLPDGDVLVLGQQGSLDIDIRTLGVESADFDGQFSGF